MTAPNPAGPPAGPELRRARRWLYTATAVAAAMTIVLIVVVLTVLVRGDEEPGTAPPVTGPTSETSPTPSPSPSSSPSATPRPFGYLALWPFTSEAGAAAWQTSYRAGGHQPWHLDPRRTALFFTTGYLGFTEVDRVVWRSVHGDDARIAVGFSTGTGRLSVAAVLHLARIGSGQDAPWEVVGSRDTTLTMDTPSYGARVSSPVTVGGRITGVDESLRIEVRQPSSAQPIGTRCCLPAGGERQPWSTTVAFHGATDPALTVVVSTGGHFQGVERFAVTGVRH